MKRRDYISFIVLSLETFHHVVFARLVPVVDRIPQRDGRKFIGGHNLHHLEIISHAWGYKYRYTYKSIWNDLVIW